MGNQLSITESARLAGVSRTTIYAKLNSGELSKLNNKKIEISELIRVFPNISIKKQSDNDEYSNCTDDLSSAVHLVDKSVLHIEIEYLKKETETLKNIILSKDCEISRLNNLVDRLVTTNEKLQIYALPDPKNKKPWWRR